MSRTPIGVGITVVTLVFLTTSAIAYSTTAEEVQELRERVEELEQQLADDTEASDTVAGDTEVGEDEVGEDETGEGLELTLRPHDTLPRRAQVHSRAGRREPFEPRGAEIGRINDIRFNLGFHVVGRGQWMTQSDTFVHDGTAFSEPRSLSPGMQTGFANVDFQLDIGGDIELFFDGLFATQRHPTRFWGHQGYFYIRQMPENTPLAAFNNIFEYIDVKAGNFYVDFGNEIHRRSLNADVQRNPLIGNPIVTPHGIEPGLEIIHKGDFDGRYYGVMAGAGTGAPEQDFGRDRRFSVRGKAWFEPNETVQVAGSFYHVDHGETVDRGSNLFRRERLGTPYSSVWNFGDDDSGSGEAPGQVRIGDGRRVTAGQADLNWDITDRLFLNSHFGFVNASGADPSYRTGTERWLYYGADTTFYVTDDIYIAGRYSEANSRKFLTSDNTGRVGRAQLGGGVWLTDRLLLKTEYVYQYSTGFNEGTRGVAGNVDVGQDPSFHGAIFEASYSF